jgi:hypothetical protein
MSHSVSFTCHNESYVIFPESQDTLNTIKYRIHELCHGTSIPDIETSLSKIYATGFIMQDCVIHYYFIIAQKYQSDNMLTVLKSRYPIYHKTMKYRNKLILSGVPASNCAIEKQVQKRNKQEHTCAVGSDMCTDCPKNNCSERLQRWYDLIRESVPNAKRGRPKLAEHKKIEQEASHKEERKSNIDRVYQNTKILIQNTLSDQELQSIQSTVSPELYKKLKLINETVG